MKNKYIATVVVLCAALLTGCQKDGWFKGKSGDGNLAFEATVSAQKGNPIHTKAGMISGNGVQIPLSCRIENGIGGLSANSAAATKGTLLNTTGETKPLNEYIDAFTVNGWNEDGTEFISGETASWNSTSQKWVPGTVTAWTGASEKTFYAWANLPASGAVVTNEDDGTLSLSYTELPQDAKDQTDAILGWYNGKGDSDGDGLTDGVASLAFSHPLTSVVFVKGQMDGVTGIKEISISGVYGSGDCSATFAQASEAVTPTYTWSNFGETTSTIQSADDALSIDEETNAIGEPFILIPQDLSVAAVKLSVTVLTSKGASIMTTIINTGVWASGKTAVYTLGYEDVLRAEPLSLSASEPQSIIFPQIETEDIEEFMFGGGVRTMAEGVNLWYSYDEETWTEWEDFLEPLEFGTPEHPVIFLRGDNPNGLGNKVTITEEYREEYDSYEEEITIKASKFIFENSADVVVSGNIMSLLDPTCEADSFADGVESPFCGLFAMSPVTDASDLILPAAEVPFGAYAFMFIYNERLSMAPELPATVVGDWAYAAMFMMSALEKAPDISATSVGRCACYYMFSDDQILTEAPAILPAMEIGERCYEGMFAYTRIVKAPKLPATTLKNSCYNEMFKESELREAPELPATILAPGCYNEMFYYCENMTKGPSVIPADKMEKNACREMFAYCNKLETAPDLKATILAEDCYYNMFEYCRHLKKAPEINAKTMAKRSCYYMFYGCYEMEEAPAEIPAETLAEECCCEMFASCSKLKNAPYIPATTMAQGCYYYMYSNCYELTTAPVLPATTLAERCYSGMFQSCSKLNYIKMLATDITADYCLNNWVWGVAPSGTFVKSPDLAIGTGTNQIIKDSSNGIPVGWTPVDDIPILVEDPVCFTASGTQTAAVEYVGEKPMLMYSFDKADWTLWGEPDSPVTFGDSPERASLYVCGYNPGGLSNGLSQIAHISFGNQEQPVAGSGNMMTLLDCTKDTYTIPCNYCFMGFFGDQECLASAPSLPATTLTYGCYVSMFQGCTSLVSAPELPAEQLAEECYTFMFSHCSSLVDAPVIKAETLAPYCCTYMFEKCTSLEIAPVLSAETLVEGCYCLMFTSCSKLNYIKMLATDITAKSCLAGWCKEVASTGTFVKNASLETGDGTNQIPLDSDSGIPTGWTVVESTE